MIPAFDEIISGSYQYSHYFGRLTSKGAKQQREFLGEYLYHYTSTPGELINKFLLPAILLPKEHNAYIKYRLLGKAEEILNTELIGGANEVVWLGRYIENSFLEPNLLLEPLDISGSDSPIDVLNKFIKCCRIVDTWKEALNVLKEDQELLGWTVNLIKTFSDSTYNQKREYWFYKIPTNKVIKAGIPFTLSLRSPYVVAVPFVHRNDMIQINREDIPRKDIINERICAKSRSKYKSGTSIMNFRKRRIKENLIKLGMILDGLVDIPNTTTIEQVKNNLFSLPPLEEISVKAPFNSLLNNPRTRSQLESFYKSST